MKKARKKELMVKINKWNKMRKEGQLQLRSGFVLNSITADRKLNTERRKEGTERTGGDTGSQLKVSEATTMVNRV